MLSLSHTWLTLCFNPISHLILFMQKQTQSLISLSLFHAAKDATINFHFPSLALSPLRPALPPPRPLALCPALSLLSPTPRPKPPFIGYMDFLGKVLVWVTVWFWVLHINRRRECSSQDQRRSILVHRLAGLFLNFSFILNSQIVAYLRLFLLFFML